MRGFIKLTLTSGTLLAGTALAYRGLEHPAPAAPAPAVTSSAKPASSAASSAVQTQPSPVTKPARHPFRAVMADLGAAKQGLASWYGGVRDGHRTANGEIFDKSLMTACHRTLPFGTLVKVIDLASGRSVVVRINDRGILSPGRVIDLSSAAAQELGILRAGVAKVRLEVLSKVEHTDKPQPTL